jgi:Rrf2 family transcriptional regulator, cysteine metabolism repressor
MKIPTRGRYGLRAMIDLGHNYGKGPVLLKDVAERQQISLLYLEQLIKPLVVAGLIRTERGSRGGVWLAKPPKDITLRDIMELLVGNMAPAECAVDPNVCKRSKTCATRDIWCEMKDALESILEKTTLQDLLERQKAKKEAFDEQEALTP